MWPFLPSWTSAAPTVILYDSISDLEISSSVGGLCHWSPGGSDRNGKKISQNKSLIFLAKLKGGQQLMKFMVAVDAVFKYK